MRTIDDGTLLEMAWKLSVREEAAFREIGLRTVGELRKLLGTPLAELELGKVLTRQLRKRLDGMVIGHAYTSTACYHGHHRRCRRQCKFCPSMCGCGCHK